MTQQLFPAKVIRVRLISLTPIDTWGQEPFPAQPWTFEGVLSVDPTVHSDLRTPRPGLYTGLDVEVGDFITTQSSKILKISEIFYQNDYEVRCKLEDFFRLNSSVDDSQGGESAIQLGVGLLFTVKNGRPILHPLPLDTGIVTPQDLVDIYGRFFYLYQETLSKHLFELADVSIAGEIVDNSILTYDAVSEKWIAATSTGILPVVTPRAVLFGDSQGLIASTTVSNVDGSFLKEDSAGNPYWSNIIDGGSY